MGCMNESLVYVLPLKKNNWCLERTVVVHQAQNTVTQPRKAPCKVSTRKMKPTWEGDQNTGLQSDPTACDSSHCLSVADKKVSAVTSIPLSRLCLGAPHVSLCSRHFTLITDTLTCTSYCPSRSFSWHSSCVACAGKDGAHTAGSLPAGDSLTQAEQLCPPPPQGACIRSPVSFCPINGRKGAEPKSERAVLWLCVCHTFPCFKFSPMTNSFFKCFKQK